MIHAKEYNSRRCRKGLLERGLKCNVAIGSFKNLNNQLIKNYTNGKIDTDALTGKYKECTVEAMKNELNDLKADMTALDKTIGNLRMEAKSKLDAVSYENWKKIIHEASVDYTKLFSESNDSLFLLAQKEETGLTNWLNKINTRVFSLLSKYGENRRLEKSKLFRDDIGEGDISKIVEDEEAAKSKKDQLLKEIVGVLDGKEFILSGNKEELFLQRFLELANEFKGNNKERHEQGEGENKQGNEVRDNENGMKKNFALQNIQNIKGIKNLGSKDAGSECKGKNISDQENSGQENRGKEPPRKKSRWSTAENC